MAAIKFLGHACVQVRTNGYTLIIDPFLTDNPAAAVKPDDIQADFTMGIDDAVEAVKYLKPKRVVPLHYNTWELIQAEAKTFAQKVGTVSEVKILDPGETIDL